MTPNLPVDNIEYNPLADAESFSQVPLLDADGAPYLKNHILGKLVIVGCLAVAASVAIPSFFHHVVGVVLCGSQEQMIRVHTGPIIALVENPHTFWNRTSVNNPGNSMSRNGGHLSSPRELSVSITFIGEPVPAPISLSELVEESGCECGRQTLFREVFRTKLDTCDVLFHCHRAGPGRLLAAPGHTFNVANKRSVST